MKSPPNACFDFLLVLDPSVILLFKDYENFPDLSLLKDTGNLIVLLALFLTESITLSIEVIALNFILG